MAARKRCRIGFYRKNRLKYIVKKKKMNFSNFKRLESFSKRFKIVTGFPYNGKLKIKTIGLNVNINSTYKQKHILLKI